MKVVLSIRLAKEEHQWGENSEVLFKTTEWDAIPPSSEATIQFGVSEDGESGLISAYRPQIYWDTTGTVHIGMECLNLRDEYEDVKQLALNEGFLPFSEWKDNE
jgi:hypothetical protein